MSANNRLATYGTLAPGRLNNHELAGLKGTWFEGTIKGTLIEAGWGADLGYPGLILDSSGDDIEVFIFDSPDLPGHWDRLDAFEGEGYQRTTTLAKTEDGAVEVSIYAIKKQ